MTLIQYKDAFLAVKELPIFTLRWFYAYETICRAVDILY